MFDVSVHSDFDFLSPGYAALFDRSDATAFQHPLWLHHLYATLAPAVGADPFVVVVRHDDGRLAMVLPLLRLSRGLMTVLEFADLRVSDYASPVCDRATFAAILHDERSQRQIRGALGRFDLLRIAKIRSDGLPVAELFGAGPASRMRMSAHAVPLHGPYPQWRARFMDPSLVRAIDRKWRRLERTGMVSVECVVDGDAVEATLEDLLRFCEQRFRSRDHEHILQDPRYFRFYSAVVKDGAASGFLRMYRLGVDDRTVAADFGLSHRRVYLDLLKGFDAINHKDRSVGMLMHDAVLADCVARGDCMFDLTIGDEAYKQLFGTTPTALLTVTARGTVIGSLAEITAERLPRVHRVAKRLLGA